MRYASLPAGDAYVCTLLDVMFNCIFGGLAAFSLIKLTTEIGGDVVTFIEHFFR
jgi:hypothetical protein